MTRDECRDWRGAVAAAALDRLDADEAVALDAHLDGCASCRDELRALRSVVVAMQVADVERLRERSEPPVELGDRVLERVDAAKRARRYRRRRRALAGAIAAALAIAVALAAVTVLVDDGASGRTVAFTDAPAGVDAEARLEARAHGTEVELAAHGLTDGEWYWLWLTGGDGRRVGAGTFTGRADGQRVELTAAIPLAETRRIWVTDADDEVVLDATLAPSNS
jgi:anti-sigma-K factor RskA